MNTFHIEGNYVRMEITNNKNNGTVYFDLDDLEKVKIRSWYIKDSSIKGPVSYVACKLNGKTVKMHRYLMNVTDRKDIIDHFDRNPLNNRKSNLRITNHSNNNLNNSFSKNNKTGRTGVKLKKGQGARSDSYVGNYNKDGKRYQKMFSISKYGKEKAFQMAEEFRLNGEEKFDIRTETTFND